MGDDVLQMDFKRLQFLATDTWIKDIWSFLHVNNLEIKTNVSKLNLLRQNDTYIMKVFQTAGYSADKLYCLNQCRKYVNATTLSDISNGDGDSIIDSAYNGHRLPFQHQRYEWPNQGNPTKDDWELWKASLRQCFMNNSSLALRDTAKLGMWLQIPCSDWSCLLYTSPSPRDATLSRMPSSA